MVIFNITTVQVGKILRGCSCGWVKFQECKISGSQIYNLTLLSIISKSGQTIELCFYIKLFWMRGGKMIRPRKNLNLTPTQTISDIKTALQWSWGHESVKLKFRFLNFGKDTTYNNEVLNQASKPKSRYDNCAVSRNVTVYMIIFSAITFFTA